ncbi:unnamed protein product [Mytilus edulis]|uniref:Transmembrane protein n=1 Tax=Mytilus edulis TaxID=6550 RepID=A0A8S3R0B1_MYTED|nr:unnamed protein product [Mytilus edulis]
MANNEESVNKNNTCLLPLVLFILIGGFIALQSYGLSRLYPSIDGNMSRLCTVVPNSDPCADVSTHDSSEENSAKDAYEAFGWMQIVCLILQIAALVALCSRILCCAEHICVKYCYDSWNSACSTCGLNWIALEAISGIVSIISAIILAASPLSAEDIRQINGFVPCVITGVFGIVKSIGYCVYHQKVGFPPNDVFLGKNLKYSDVKVTPHVQHDTDVNGNPRQLVTHTMHY